MTIIIQIIIGTLMIISGVLLIKNNYQVANSMRISFAEDHLGPGGSFLLWKIMSVLFIFAGFTVIFGIYDNILTWVLSPVTNMINPND